MNQAISKSTVALGVFLFAVAAIGVMFAWAQIFETPPPPPIESNTPTTGLCNICGESIVAAHGSVLLKNTTQHEVVIYARRHPGYPEDKIALDPQGFKTLNNVLVGNMRLRFTGDGFNEESYCTIAPNTTHEMWWTIRGPEMHGTGQMHIGQSMGK